MGLDMYLKAKHYVGGWDHLPAGDKQRFGQILELVGLTREQVADGSPSLEVEVTAAYWRKANEIHQWFVENVQGGKDDCTDFYVEREQLQELIELAQKAVATKDASLLPPQEGFFFGSTAIDEYYWEDITNTIETLTEVLKNFGAGWDFFYRASW